MNKFNTFLKNVFASSRAYSLYWRTADMALPVMADIALNELKLMDLPNILVLMIGLILGEITKYLNTKANAK